MNSCSHINVKHIMQMIHSIGLDFFFWYFNALNLQALLGAQLVMTLIMVSVIQKLSPHYSLAKWILCSTGLIRFLHPTDNELKTLAGM